MTEGRGDDAARIAAEHFTLSENLIRELVERAEHEGSRAGGAEMSRQLMFVAAAPAAHHPRCCS